MAGTPSAKALLQAHGLAPKRSFGQNFLQDRHIAERIAHAACAGEGGTVLEIGAGLGALTRHLLERGVRVVAVERDRDLVPILIERFGDAIRVVEADAAKLDWLAVMASDPPPYRVVGNLPYQITGRLVERAVTVAHTIERAVFMVQREVADRLVAQPGEKAYGVLSVFTQAAFAVERLLKVSRGAFYPQPNVDSAVVVLTALSPPRAEETAAFRRVVKLAFEQRRKKLRNAWSRLVPTRDELAVLAERAQVSLDARAETLAVEDFGRLAVLLDPPGA